MSTRKGLALQINKQKRVVWNIRNIKSLFSLFKQVSCGIYEGIRSCGKNYIGETERNFETHWNEHRNTKNTPDIF